jgi:flavin-dependent dehydrogenase
MQRFSSSSVVLDGEYRHTNFGKTASFGIVRSEFDEFLARRAAGVATLMEGMDVQTVERRDGTVAVHTRSGQTFTARVVIGAGGSHCPVQRAFGRPSTAEDMVLALESETRLDEATLRRLTPHYGTAELFPEPDFKGYGWFVTKGDFLNIGLGRFKGATSSLRTDYDRFLSELGRLGRLRGVEERLAPHRGHSYKVYDDVPRTRSGDGFVLVGDAAGLATRWAGEGIRPAVQSGAWAAEVIDEALASGDAGAGALSRYDARCDRAWGIQRETALHRLMARVPVPAMQWIGRQICRRGPLRRKLIFELAFGFRPVDY